MSKQKCLDCNGSGEVEATTSYREPAAMDIPEEPPAPKPKKDWSPFWRSTRKVAFWSAIWGGIAIGFVLGAACLGEALKREVQENNQRINKMGYLVARYGADDAVVRCWVVSPQTQADGSGKLYVKGPDMPFANMTDIKVVEVPDRNDVDGFARSIGIKDASQCIR